MTIVLKSLQMSNWKSNMSSRPPDNKLHLEDFNEETVSNTNSMIRSHLSWHQGIERHNAYA